MRLPRLIAAVLATFVLAHPASAAIFEFSTPIAGDSVPVTVELSDVAPDAVATTISVPAGQGDLLGLFGNVVDESIVAGMGVASTGIVTQWQFAVNAVDKVGPANLTIPVGDWDWGVAFDQQGSSGGAVGSASFELTGPGLSVAQLIGAANQGWVFGVRIQSTTGPEGSAKIGMPEGTPPVVEPPVIAITSPADGALVGSPVAVTGTVLGTAPSVDVNGGAATVSGGSWTATLALPDGVHTLTATATNAIGSHADSITVTVDTSGPQITIMAPAAGSIVAATPIPVSGIVADASAVTSVSIEGMSFPVSGGSFSGSANLVEGANTISVTAQDALGNLGQASVGVTLDTIAPAVTITAPTDGTLTTDATIGAEGSVADASAIASFTVNGQLVPLDGANAFTASVALALGANPVTATATDAAGNVGSASVTVTRGEFPTIAIASPAEGFLTAAASLAVTGTAGGATAVTVNGVAATLTGADWTATVPLVEGPNTLTATASNAFGSAQASVSGTRDSTPPSVTILAPEGGDTIASSPVTVSGAVFDASAFTVTVNGVAATVSGSGFTASVPLSAGATTLTAVAIDAAGNSGSDSVTVQLASEELTVTIGTPLGGSLVSRERIAVAGTVSNSVASVLVNGVQATVTGGSWTAAAVPLTEGPNTLTAAASLGASTASDSVAVTLNLSPEISIRSPLSGAVIRGETTDVDGFVSDPLALVDVNGVPATVDSGGRFVAESVPLDPGPNDLVARAIDLQGAQGSDRAGVTRDGAAGPFVRVVIAHPYNFQPYPNFAMGDIGSRLIGFEKTEDWLAAMERIGRPASGFLPPPQFPPVFGTNTEIFVLTEDANVPSIEFAFPDGHRSDYLVASHGESGPIETILESTAFFELWDNVNPEVFQPSDAAARFFHLFHLGFQSTPDAYSAPLEIRGVQDIGADSITVFFDVENVVTEMTTPLDAVTEVSGATVVATGPAADNHSLGAVTYNVLHFPGGFTEIDLGPGEGGFSDGRFLVSDAPLGIGRNNLRVSVHDASSANLPLLARVDRNPDAPAVSLAFPKDGQALVESEVSVSLSLGAPLTLVAVNGVPDGRAFPAGLAEDVLPFALAFGPNLLSLEVLTSAGSFFYDFTLYRVAALDPPRITAPAAGAFVNTDTLLVEGVVPLGTPYVEVNGVPGVIETGGVRFTAEIPVPQDLGVEAVNGDAVLKKLAVTVIAYPQATSSSIRVTPDFAGPEFRFVLPEDGAETIDPTVTYGGWISEPGTVRLTYGNGEQVRTTLRDRQREQQQVFNLFNALQYHRFDFDAIGVAPGVNSVTLTARDLAGNESQIDLDVTAFGAALTLTSPLAPVATLSTDLVFDVHEDVQSHGLFANGRFLGRSLGLPAGIVTLQDVPLEPGLNEMRLVYQRSTGFVQQALNFTVESADTGSALLTGRVVDPDTGEGIWGALVTLEIGGQTIVVATRPDGSFEVVVAPGQIAGSVTAIGYASASFDLEILAGETVETQVTLAPAGAGESPRIEEVELFATVRDASTLTPIQGVTVEALGEGVGAVDTTDAAGLAELTALRVGDQTLRFRRRGFLDHFATRQIAPPAMGATVAESFDIAWVQSELGTLAVDPDAEGSVLDGLTLRPLAGAQIEARDLGTGQQVGATVAGADGRFSLSALPRFATVEISANHPDYAPQSIEALVVPRGDERLDLRLLTTGAGRIEGTITDASTGLPLPLAHVGLAGAPLRTVSEGGGVFVLMNTPAGTYDLSATHPAYFPATITGVTVSSGATVSASASLTPRPTTGGMFGVVRRAPGELPVPGASILAAAGPATTADAEGRFSLSGLPAGLNEFTISAGGFPSRVETAVVDADIDAVTPTETYVEFDFSATPLEASADIPIEGGILQLPDASVRIDFPPLALSGDAKVTLQRRETPQVVSGDTLSMDPALGLTDIAALGQEFVLRIESQTPGETAPFFVGPILVSGRYSAAAAAALGGREDVAFPVYYDADNAHWTVPRVVPHLHLVDTVNRLSVTGLSLLVTETGAPVTARLVSPNPIQLAGFADLPVIRRQAREIVIALARVVQPLLGIDRVAQLHVLAPADLVGLGQNIEDAKQWDNNARPVFVFHGWSPQTTFWNVQPEERSTISERYAQIIGDVARATDSVYRPAYATYNTRVGLEDLGSLVAARVGEQEAGPLRGIPSDPHDPGTGPLFGSYDSLGFSMGGLIERAYQRQVNGTGLQIQSMVAMATPHHGGLQQVRRGVFGALLSETGFLGAAGVEALLSLWSPGTADLLDYDEFACRFLGAEFSGNATLCRMNRDPLTAPASRLSLIAGTDSISLFGLFDQFAGVLDQARFEEVVEKVREAIDDSEFLGVDVNPLDELLSEGFVNTGCIRSDGVVCVWSAHARTGPTGGDVTVPALANSLAKTPSLRDFNHHQGGGVTQPIEGFVDEDVIQTLTDHYIGRLQELQFVEPTTSQPGEVRFVVDVEYNAPNGDITALVPVVYGRYEDPPGQFRWKILAGADEIGEPDPDVAHQIDADGPNSVGGQLVELTAANDNLPPEDPMDPSTDLNLVQPVLIGIGPSQPTVPVEPPQSSFNFPPPPEP